LSICLSDDPNGEDFAAARKLRTGFRPFPLRAPGNAARTRMHKVSLRGPGSVARLALLLGFSNQRAVAEDSSVSRAVCELLQGFGKQHPAPILTCGIVRTI